ncbi:putative flavonol synthase [Medicago truncatula]|uniref:Flavonol synthase/flavanone 3-hydroxylase n=1 Tax=Medicago truncatula TaxID=3880 RepID=G7JV63_MEDTR|nr:2-oxoglutarate-dependent dioxygenase 19 [Medicago truncatula]AES90611.1 flavonol synthase/flavanone 3-hydroxylase [Medicago truncatula]RHN62679.1 putative flavonol synthase [Medicago truncatula]
MASTLPPQVNQKSNNGITPFTSVKTLSESPDFNSIPSSYTYTTNPHDENEIVADQDEVNDPIPVIDYSLLINGNHDQRTKTIHDIGKACEEWGFFILTNHSVSKSLMEKMVDQVFAFFNLKEEDKQVYADKEVTDDSIKYGTSFNVSGDKNLFWRDFIKIIVHPKFHSPDKPSGFRETSAEYSRKTWKLGRELLKGISESLGLEVNYIDKTMNLDSGLQMLAANLYPPCPQPDLAMGMPPHSDHGLLNLLIQNGVSGLQVLHNGKWINVSSTSNCFLVLVSDHLEIMSNGKYKSVVHRAAVSNGATRMSLATVIAPSLDTVVEPASELLDNESNPAAYVGMKHIDYMKLQRNNQLYGKSVLNKVKI